MFDLPFSPSAWLDGLLRSAAQSCLHEPLLPEMRPAEPRFGDLQSNCALPLAKRLKETPRALALRLLEALHASSQWDSNLCQAAVAGPGFLNFTFSPAFLLGWLQKFRGEDDYRRGAMGFRAGQTVVVDFSSPNTAKQMHVGHIRSTVIGESLCRLLAFAGARVIRDNHLGDWGTQFGILLETIKRSGTDLDSAGAHPLEGLESLYRDGAARFKESESVREAARRELVALQNGDPINLAIWDKITRLSYGEFAVIYKRLGVSFDHVLGESFYRDRVEAVCRELVASGLAVEDDGALVVFHPGHARFATQPFIIRKRDGASNYATTDLATILYRTAEWQAGEIVYVVDSRQSDHFDQLFLTAQKWFAATGRTIPALRHVNFGTILGEDGKAIKTRSGESVKLRELLDEAEERAYRLVTERNPDSPEDQRRHIARVVGLGSVKYSDLSQNRSSDYVFSWDKMLSLEGNTAPYLLYAVARLHSLFRKAGLAPGEGEEAADPFASESEIALARALIAFPNALEMSLQDFRPHLLAGYLYDLSGKFSTFYNADRILVEDPPVRARRLLLAARVLRTLETGLHLLGLETLDRM